MSRPKPGTGQRRVRLPRVRRPNSFPDLVVVALLVLVAAKGFVWVTVTPVWQLPDEPAHFAYVDSIARGEGLTRQPRFLTERVWRSLNAAEFESIAFHPEYPGILDENVRTYRHNTLERIGRGPSGDDMEIRSSADNNPPLYYALSAAVVRLVGDQSVAVHVYALRVFGVLLGVTAMLLQFKLFVAAFRDRFRATAAALLLTSMPMYTWSQASVNPDVLVMVWASALLLLLLRGATGGWRGRDVAAAGLVLGLGLLTKVTMIVFAPACVGLLAWMVWRHRIRLRTGAMYLGGATILSVAPSAWFYLGWGASGSGGATDPARHLSALSLDGIRTYWPILEQVFPSWVNMFWGSFGWVDTNISRPWYVGLAAVSIVLVSWALLAAINARRMRPDVLVLAGTFLVFTMFLLALDYHSQLAGAGNFIQGRYFFPLLPAAIVLLIQGCCAAIRPQLIARSILCLSVFAIVCLHVVALLHHVIPRYHL